MTGLIGIHSDSWCLIFPHPKEITRKDINNYVPFFYVFTLPSSLTHASRTEEALKGESHRFIQIAAYTLCEGTDHLEKIFQDIMDQGGEGIILRDPSAPLQAGRSTGFLKHKVSMLAYASTNRKYSNAKLLYHLLSEI